jgi:hypothetical protein
MFHIWCFLIHCTFKDPINDRYWGAYCNKLAFYVKYKGKGKAVPLQAWSGPEVSRKLRFPDFMTTAQDGGKVVSLTHRPPLPPGNTPVTHFC